MRSGCLGLLTVLLAFHASPAAAQSSLEARLDACIQRYTDVPAPMQMDLAQDCPELSEALEEGAPSQIWPPVKDLAPFEQLIDLQRGLAVRRATLPRNASLDPVRLDALLSTIAVPTSPPPAEGLWERFLNWLEDKLSGMGRRDETWLGRFIRNMDLPPWVYRYTMMGMGLIIIALAVIIVVGEFRGVTLRHLLRMRRDAFDPEGNGPTGGGKHARLTLRSISDMDLRTQPAALFRYAVRIMIERRVLTDDPSRTNRELAITVQQQVPDVSALFGDLAERADEALYGDREPTSGEASVLRDRVTEFARLSEGRHA